MSQKLKRRQFLKLSGVALGVAAGGWISIESAREWIYSDDWIYKISGISKSDPRAQAFAAKCAEIVSPGSVGFQVSSERMKAISKDQFRKLVVDAVQADYQNNRLEDVDGWVLSRTEVELFALGHSAVPN